MLFPQTQLLLVDDSPLNLNILLEFLREKEYSCTTAQSGVQAWNMLEREPDRFHAVLLDRIMPEMDGMEVLHRMKHHTVLSQIPVIMQTAASTHQQTLEGLQAGAYYYLAKPFDKATLQAIVDAAVRDHISYLDVRQDLRRTTTTMRLLNSGTFRFKTPEEAKNLAMLLAHAYPDANRVVTGILELTLNAIEHGNLNIGYKEKSRLIEEERLDNEIERRLSDPLYSSREATAQLCPPSRQTLPAHYRSGQGIRVAEVFELRPRASLRHPWPRDRHGQQSQLRSDRVSRERQPGDHGASAWDCRAGTGRVTTPPTTTIRLS
jgi:DNA-binding response OmpR family regulator